MDSLLFQLGPELFVELQLVEPEIGIERDVPGGGVKGRVEFVCVIFGTLVVGVCRDDGF
jgi:hypothetical protein